MPAAANRGDRNEVRRILDSGDFTQHDLDQALSRATCSLGQHPERHPIGELVRRGADVNTRCESDHACAIHFAAERGHLDFVQFLADAGSEIEAGDNDHQLNVLGWATSLGSYQEEVARYLLAHGAKMSIWSAIALNDTEAARSLIAADPSVRHAQMSRNEYFRSPLHHAVSRNRPLMVRLLLELGADPHACDAMGLSVLGAGNADTDPEILTLFEAKMESPNLHDALTLGRFDLAKALLATDPACIKPGGAEARVFVYAVCRKNWVAAEWLLEHGADTTIPDGTHQADALGWAEFFEKSDIIAMLKEHRGTG